MFNFKTLWNKDVMGCNRKWKKIFHKHKNIWKNKKLQQKLTWILVGERSRWAKCILQSRLLVDGALHTDTARGGLRDHVLRVTGGAEASVLSISELPCTRTVGLVYPHTMHYSTYTYCTHILCLLSTRRNMVIKL